MYTHIYIYVYMYIAAVQSLNSFPDSYGEYYRNYINLCYQGFGLFFLSSNMNIFAFELKRILAAAIPDNPAPKIPTFLFS